MVRVVVAAGLRQLGLNEDLTEAIALAPEEAGPVAALGRVYMQTGQEAKAKEVLEKAHRIDDFRQDVYNYLKLPTLGAWSDRWPVTSR